MVSCDVDGMDLYWCRTFGREKIDCAMRAFDVTSLVETVSELFTCARCGMTVLFPLGCTQCVWCGHCGVE